MARKIGARWKPRRRASVATIPVAPADPDRGAPSPAKPPASRSTGPPIPSRPSANLRGSLSGALAVCLGSPLLVALRRSVRTALRKTCVGSSLLFLQVRTKHITRYRSGFCQRILRVIPGLYRLLYTPHLFVLWQFAH